MPKVKSEKKSRQHQDVKSQGRSVRALSFSMLANSLSAAEAAELIPLVRKLLETDVFNGCASVGLLTVVFYFITFMLLDIPGDANRLDCGFGHVSVIFNELQPACSRPICPLINKL